jgi:hypothetical protein
MEISWGGSTIQRVSAARQPSPAQARPQLVHFFQHIRYQGRQFRDGVEIPLQPEWYWRASLRKAFLMSSAVASRATLGVW